MDNVPILNLEDTRWRNITDTSDDARRIEFCKCQTQKTYEQLLWPLWNWINTSKPMCAIWIYSPNTTEKIRKLLYMFYTN